MKGYLLNHVCLVLRLYLFLCSVQLSGFCLHQGGATADLVVVDAGDSETAIQYPIGLCVSYTWLEESINKMDLVCNEGEYDYKKKIRQQIPVEYFVIGKDATP